MSDELGEDLLDDILVESRQGRIPEGYPGHETVIAQKQIRCAYFRFFHGSPAVM